MGAIDWSFNLGEFLRAVAIVFVASAISLIIVLIRRHRSPKTPSLPFKAENTPRNAFSHKSGKETDTKPNKRRVSDGVNEFNHKQYNKNKS